MPIPEHESLMNQIHAEAKLAALDVYDDLGELFDEEVGRQRDYLRRRFRQLVGVDPEQRHDLRRVLQRVEQTGQITVDEAVHHVNQTAKPSSSASA
jgi:CO dehydrogenase/acetyl-CoA synthase alpha subunit